MVIKLYKTKKAQQANGEGPELNGKQMIKQISIECGLGQKTVAGALSEYRNKGTVTSVVKKRIRQKVTDKIYDFDQNAIKQKVHEFWLNRQLPTFNKILKAINEDPGLPNLSQPSLRSVLKHLNFEFIRKSRDSVVIERNDVVCNRRKYLETIKHYRQLNRPIYYLDEIWINVDETISNTLNNKTVNAPTDELESQEKVKRLIVMHIGSSDGFVVGGYSCFESTKHTNSIHLKMNSNTFYDWFMNVLPLLKDNAVIVMNNAFNNTAKKYSCPAMTWKKEDIIKWLQNKGELIDRPMVKAQLLEQIQLIKPQYDQYVIDELAKTVNKTVVRLPQFHNELNPILLAWASVKNYVRMNNTTFNTEDVRKLLEEGVKQITPDIWENFVARVVKEEDKLWEIDFISDELLEETEQRSQVIKISSGSSSDCNSDDD